MSEQLSPMRETPADPFCKLAPRPGDIELPAEELTRLLGLFKGIKANLGLKTNPDTLRVRRFQADEPICQRGEPGNSAFYLLPAQDLSALRERLAAEQARGVAVDSDLLAALARAHAQAKERAALIPESDKLAAEIVQLEEAALQAGDVSRASLYSRCRLAGTITKLVQSELLKDTEPGLARLLGRLAVIEDQRRVAVARVPSAPLAVRRQQTFWQRLLGTGGAERTRNVNPATIPNDGPADIDYDSGEAPLYDDELFGEMACIDRQPRTATVVAARECFVLEVLRPILDNMRKDAAYREKLDAKYRERVLELHLRALPLFKDLNAGLITRIRQDAELLAYEPGTLICDEHEPSDALYLIRSGTVRVMKRVSALFSMQDIRDWGQVGQLSPSHPGAHTAARETLWKLLGTDAQALALSPAALESPQARHKLLDALNGLIADPELGRRDGLAEVMLLEQCHLRAWQALVKDGREFATTLHGFNRVLLGVLLLGKLAALKLGDDGQLPAPLKTASIPDWKAFCTDLEPTNRKPDHPAAEAARWLWNRLPSAVQTAVREGKAGAVLSDEAKQLIVSALNQVSANSFLLIEPELQQILEAEAALQRLVMEFRRGGQKWTEHDFRRYSRFRNRLVFHALYPGFLGAPPSDAGSPLVLAYCTRGDFIGEMGLVLAEPRSATCVAYNHPENDPAREVGPVQLVRIPRELFDYLRQSSQLFADRVEASVRRRQEQTRKKQREAEQAAKQRRLPLASEADDLGLTQGQRLMLIDLDRCTRCDECVKACVATHDDGASRLFLDGPRFQQQVGQAVRSFLAPTTCRSCIDPVCMIPCPVGSIVRGEHGQIEIRDWCIGCEKCAKNCPYGAIQMHPTGVLPARSSGWRLLPAWKVRADSRGRPWHAHDHHERGWHTVQTPLVLDRHLQNRLGNLPSNGTASRAVCLRHSFDIDDVGRRIRPDTKFRLVITPYVAGTKLWLNGQAVADVESKKGEGLRELELETSAKPSKALKILKPGRNVAAVEVPLQDDLAGPFFELKIVIFEGTVLDLRAVVCDLCQLQPGELTACVKACPHEATRRFDARQGIIVW